MISRAIVTLIISLGLSTAALVGCSVGQLDAKDNSVDEEAGQAGSSDAVRHVTVVHVDPDPTKIVVTRETKTAAQFDAMVDARMHLADPVAHAGANGLGTAQQAISRDTSCSNGASMWVFDSTNSSDRDLGESCGFACWNDDLICFIGSGSVFFDDYVWQNAFVSTTSWEGRIRAYWPGCSAGQFVDGEFVESFSGGQSFTLAGGVAESALSMNLYSNCMN